MIMDAAKSIQPERLHKTESEADVDAAIEACGGDLRATIKAVLVANTFLKYREIHQRT
jgi:hypothetical protein